MNENMRKLQTDRQYFQSVLVDVLEEVRHSGTIDSLKTSVKQYQEDKQHMAETITKYSIQILTHMPLAYTYPPTELSAHALLHFSNLPTTSPLSCPLPNCHIFQPAHSNN